MARLAAALERPWQRFLHRCLRLTNTLGTRPQLGHRWITTAKETGSAAWSPSLLLGRGGGAGKTTGAFVQRSNAIFAKIRSGQASSVQLVEALQALAALGREATPDDLEVMSSHQQFRQLLDELTQQLPKDTSQQVDWDPKLTPQVITALQELRVQEAGPLLCVRLGHTIVQAPEPADLGALLHQVYGLCKLDARGVAPDDYVLWVLGTKLEELCRSRSLGELRMAELVSILHLFAHPAIRGRVAARGSPVVLRHVRQGLSECGPSEIAKLLQAYPDVPDIVSDALRALLQAGGDGVVLLAHVGLPELAAIATALPAQGVEAGGIAKEVLARLGQIVDESTASSIELMAMSATNAVKALPGGDADAAGVAVSVVDALGSRAVSLRVQTGTLAQLVGTRLSMGLSSSPQPAPSDAEQPPAGAPPSWLPMAAEALASQMGALAPARLAELATQLASVDAGVRDFESADLFEALQTAAVACASSLSPGEFAAIAGALASAGTLSPSLLEAYDLEACLVRPVAPATLAGIAWAMASTEEGAVGATAWELVAAQLEGGGEAAWSAARGPEQALLFEALQAHSVLSGAAWAAGTRAEEILADSGWRDRWLERREHLAPPSTHGDIVAGLLEDMKIEFTRDDQGGDGLYARPFYLPEQGVVIDHMARPPRHPVSRRPCGELMLRHRVWAADNASVLAIPDSTWAKLAGELPEADGAAQGDSSAGSRDAAVRARQREWLEGKLALLHAEDVANTVGLEAGIAQQLRGVPLGEGGVNVEGLRFLKEQPLAVQQRAVRKFLDSWSSSSIRSPTGWLIGIIKKEVAILADEEEAKREKVRPRKDESEKQDPDKKDSDKKELDAAVARPTTGWDHPSGTPLDEVKPGQVVEGRVTNVMHNRVWVDAGFMNDGTFMAQAGRYSVGDMLRHLEVVSVNHDKRRVELKVTAATTRELRNMAKEAKEAAKAKATAKAMPRGAKPKPSQAKSGTGRTASADERAQAARNKKGWREAMAAKPREGWGHEGGRHLSELRVGEVIEGRVTNVLFERVWVDIGAAKDASFWTKSGGVSIGDVLTGLVVTSINLDKNHVVLQPSQAAGGGTAATAGGGGGE